MILKVLPVSLECAQTLLKASMLAKVMNMANRSPRSRLLVIAFPRLQRAGKRDLKLQRAGKSWTAPISLLKTSRELGRASNSKGRAIYCRDLARQHMVIAAAVFHIHPKPRTAPVLVTRFVTSHIPNLRAESIGGALILKPYLHAIGVKSGRGDVIMLELPAAVDRDVIDFYRINFGFENQRHSNEYGRHATLMSQPSFGT